MPNTQLLFSRRTSLSLENKNRDLYFSVYKGLTAEALLCSFGHLRITIACMDKTVKSPLSMNLYWENGTLIRLFAAAIVEICKVRGVLKQP